MEVLKTEDALYQVYSSIRKNVGANFPVSIKLNSADFQRGGFTEEESLGLITALSDAGMDLIEISGTFYEAPVMTGIMKKKHPTTRSLLWNLPRKRKAQNVRWQLPVVFVLSKVWQNAITSGAVDVRIARSPRH